MIAPGTLLQNRYRSVKQIGQGGMGAVYVATDDRFHSTVALKETFFDDPTLRKAFEREAHLLNRLRHAALPKVTDHFGEDAGLPRDGVHRGRRKHVRARNSHGSSALRDRLVPVRYNRPACRKFPASQSVNLKTTKASS